MPYQKHLACQNLGLQGRALITLGKGLKTVQLSPLQIAEIAASESGFYDLDVKPTGIGTKVEIEARSQFKDSVRATGSDEADAVMNLLTKFGWE